MPGELANIIAGRVANLFNLRGPNFTTDAACASGLAALSAAAKGLAVGDFDAVVAGGVDRNMGVAAFVKFCKIGALSATGPARSTPAPTASSWARAGPVRPQAAGRRRARRRPHLRGAAWVGGSSATARARASRRPNPVGQKLADRARLAQAGVDPATVGLIEAHGTSTRVGDAAEPEASTEVYRRPALAPGTIALGVGQVQHRPPEGGRRRGRACSRRPWPSEKVLPPSLNFSEPNPNVDWANSPFRVNTELREWPRRAGRAPAGVSAFGFGGTNFHAALEEYVPGRHRDDRAQPPFAGADIPATGSGIQPRSRGRAAAAAAPVDGQGPAAGRSGRRRRQRTALAAQLDAGRRPAASRPRAAGRPGTSRPGRARSGRHRLRRRRRAGGQGGQGRAGAVPGQPGGAEDRCARRGVFHRPWPGAARWRSCTPGRARSTSTCSASFGTPSPSWPQTFAEADAIMTPLLGKPLTEYIFVDDADPAEVARLDAAAAADRDHPAGRADRRPRAHRAARRRTASARHGDGAQPRRVRRHSWRRARCRSRRRWRRSAPAAARWRASTLPTTARWRP